MKWVCWRINVFASSSVGSYTAQQLTPSIWRKSTESAEDTWLEGAFITLAKESEANLVKNFVNAYQFHYLQNLSGMSWKCSLLNSLTSGLRGTCFLHLDNVPCSVALNVREFLAKHSFPVVPHLPYSPHSAHCHFFLCPRLKITLKGKQCKMPWKYNSIHMTAALRSWRIAAITTYNRTDPTPKKISQS